DQPNFGNLLLGFTVKLFGCPDPAADPTPFAFGLIPPEQSGRVFTTADLALLSSLYVDSVAISLQAPNFADPSVTPPFPDLTPEQLAQLRANLAQLAMSVTGTQTSSGYSDSTCSDAGGGGD